MFIIIVIVMSGQFCNLLVFSECLELSQNYIFLNNGKVFGGYWKEVHRVENVYVNLALHSIREMAAFTRLGIFQHQNFYISSEKSLHIIREVFHIDREILTFH